MRKRIDLTQKIETKTKTTIKKTTTRFYHIPLYNQTTTVEEEETNELEDESEELTENENDNNETSNDNNNDSNNSSSENTNQENLSNNTQNVPNQANNTNGFINGVKSAVKNARKSAKAATDGAKTKAATTILKNPLVIKILLIILVVAICFLGLLFVITLIASIYDESNSISFGGYYSSRCDEMTVIFVDSKNGYAVTGSETYSMEDYVAGVVYAEVGGAQNIEVYKTFAVAARTFALKHASDDCAIEGSARRQAFKDITDRPNEAANMIYEAVSATEGQVIMTNGELYSVLYDAFCYISKDSSYYTLSQQNQKIPTDWVESNIRSFAYTNCPCNLNDESMTGCWSNGVWQDGGHGKGMSQYGSYYLAKELGYTYDEILEYYYGEEISISSSSFMTSIAGLEIKDTTKASALKEPITTFLSSKGSSLDDLNNFIHESVEEQGPGTREGVVTAAVSLINYLYDNFNVRLPYYWGGKIYNGTSIPASFGTYSPSAISRGGGVNYYKSFDCSGFASWAIRTGGYNFSNQSTVGFDSNYSQNSCNITDATCIGQPGDLINSRSGHVELIIAVDEENGKYFVAHSGGSAGVVMMQRDMHKGHSSSAVTKIIFMEEFYSNPSNVNTAY